MEDKYKKEYLAKWALSKSCHEAYKLWLYYNYQCEIYDSQVCTGSNEYEDYMSATRLEFKKSYDNARKQLEYINFKRKCLESEGVLISDVDWQSTKKHFARYKLEQLEKEYKYYFENQKEGEEC